MSDGFEIKICGDKISRVKFIDSSLGAERFVTGTYDSEVSHAVELLVYHCNKLYDFFCLYQVNSLSLWTVQNAMEDDSEVKSQLCHLNTLQTDGDVLGLDVCITTSC